MNMRGFTLIETLVAMVILSIMGLAILSGVATSHKSTIIANEQTVAQSLARSQMEYVQHQVYSSTYSPFDSSIR